MAASSPDDPNQSKRPEGNPDPVGPTTPSADEGASDTPPRCPPEGVDEQCGQDEAAEAMARIGLEMTDLPDSLHDANRAAVEAPKPQLMWFRRIFLSGWLFHFLARRLMVRGWEFKEHGNVGYLLSPGRKYGLMLWRGDGNTGKPHIRAQNANARGSDSREAVNSARGDNGQMALFDLAKIAPVPAARSAAATEEESGDAFDGWVPFGLPEEDRPQQWIIVLRNKVSATVRLEVQVLGPDSLSPGGYIERVALRILLPTVTLPDQAVPPVAAPAAIDIEVVPQTPPPSDDDKTEEGKI